MGRRFDQRSVSTNGLSVAQQRAALRRLVVAFGELNTIVDLAACAPDLRARAESPPGSAGRAGRRDGTAGRRPKLRGSRSGEYGGRGGAGRARFDRGPSRPADLDPAVQGRRVWV